MTKVEHYVGVNQWAQLVVVRYDDGAVSVYSSYPHGPHTYNLSAEDAERLAAQLRGER
jgi:hypothetical protein